MALTHGWNVVSAQFWSCSGKAMGDVVAEASGAATAPLLGLQLMVTGMCPTSSSGSTGMGAELPNIPKYSHP